MTSALANPEDSAPVIVTVADIAARLGEDIDAEDAGYVRTLIDDAVVLVEGYLHADFADPDVRVPRAVPRVVGRIVVRALGVDPDATASVDQVSQSVGSSSITRHYSSESSGGGVWLSGQDKIMLNRPRRRAGITSVDYAGIPAPDPTVARRRFPDGGEFGC